MDAWGRADRGEVIEGYQQAVGRRCKLSVRKMRSAK